MEKLQLGLLIGLSLAGVVIFVVTLSVLLLMKRRKEFEKSSTKSTRVKNLKQNKKNNDKHNNNKANNKHNNINNTLNSRSAFFESSSSNSSSQTIQNLPTHPNLNFWSSKKSVNNQFSKASNLSRQPFQPHNSIQFLTQQQQHNSIQSISQQQTLQVRPPTKHRQVTKVVSSGSFKEVEGSENVVVSGEKMVVSGSSVVGSDGSVVGSGVNVVGSGGNVVGSGSSVVGKGGNVVGSGRSMVEKEWKNALDDIFNSALSIHEYPTRASVYPVTKWSVVEVLWLEVVGLVAFSRIGVVGALWSGVVIQILSVLGGDCDSNGLFFEKQKVLNK